MARIKKGNICGKRIKMARVEKDMAQVDLAAALSVDFGIEVPQTTVSAIERGERTLRDFELLAIANILDVTPNGLLGYGK